MREHEPGEVPHEWICLHVELLEHLVAAPAANWLDGVAAIFLEEKFHGTSGVEGEVGHVFGFES